MKSFVRTIAIWTIVSLLFSTTKAQDVGIGASAIYNFQTESFAGGVRVEIPFNQISLVPQISYYPAFNKITEYYVGASLHLNLIAISNWTGYGILHGGYNCWLNYANNPMHFAKPNNWDGEFGFGLTTKACLRPFIEYRYNVKWRETNLSIGLIYFLNCNARNGGKSKSHSAILCPHL